MVSIWPALGVMIALGAAGLTAPVAGAEPLPESRVRTVQAEFERRQAQTRTFQSGIRQTLRLPGVRDPIESEGSLYYAKPDRLLIVFERPAGESVLIRGPDIYLARQGDEPVHHRIDPAEPPGNMGMMLELFRDGAVRLKDDYRMEMSESASGLTVVLHSDDDDERVRSIENRLRKSDLEIESIEVRLESGQSVRYEFTGIRRNEPLDESRFDPPSIRPGGVR